MTRERRALWHLTPGVLGLLVGVVLPLGGCEGRAGTSSPQAGDEPRPNIIFILVDTLRADRLGCYGHPGNLSPMMDELAREGVLFERAISAAPWTLPSVASCFCGYYPTVHQLTSCEEATDSGGTIVSIRYLGDQFTTLAEALQTHGYETAGFSANPFVIPNYGFAQGFERFDASFAANDVPGGVVNAAALKWLAARDSRRPFFLYLHYMDVHDPYTAARQYVRPLVMAVEKMPGKRRLTPEEVERHQSFFAKSAAAFKDAPRHRRLFQYAEYWQARYDAGVPQVDQYLSELRDKLMELGLWDDAYVILTADHGESLGEHGFWAHGRSAHQDQLHVPLILRWPDRLPAGKRIPETVPLFDVMPTLLTQLQIPPPTGIQARSLSQLIDGQTTPSLPAFAEAVKQKPGQKALVLDQWKLMAYSGKARYKLYDLDADPTEQHDLAADLPERVAELRRLLQTQVAENTALGAGVEVQRVEVAPAELERLRALGYLEENPGPQDGNTVGDMGDDARKAPERQPPHAPSP